MRTLSLYSAGLLITEAAGAHRDSVCDPAHKGVLR